MIRPGPYRHCAATRFMLTLNKPLARHCLLVAHGSRLEASNAEIRVLAALLDSLSTEFSQIECAFLEIAKPSIPDGLRHLIAQGAQNIVVVPYFLSAGRHVMTDIPEQVAGVQSQFPAIDIRITAYIGANKGMAELVLAHVLSSPEQLSV